MSGKEPSESWTLENIENISWKNGLVPTETIPHIVFEIDHMKRMGLVWIWKIEQFFDQIASHVRWGSALRRDDAETENLTSGICFRR